jgi:transcription elongation factor GreB
VSKAFTRESEESGAEEVPYVRPQLPAGARNYITRDGADRLKRSLDELLETKRALVTGDTEADRRKIESAIRRLQQILGSVVFADAPTDRERIAFGATVRVRRGKGEEESYQIVGVEEADPERGRISWISPLARALLSRRAGDKVRFRSPRGEEELTVLTVRYAG